jgi:hypothetical protein
LFFLGTVEIISHVEHNVEISGWSSEKIICLS